MNYDGTNLEVIIIANSMAHSVEAVEDYLSIEVYL